MEQPSSCGGVLYRSSFYGEYDLGGICTSFACAYTHCWVFQQVTAKTVLQLAIHSKPAFQPRRLPTPTQLTFLFSWNGFWRPNGVASRSAKGREVAAAAARNRARRRFGCRVSSRPRSLAMRTRPGVVRFRRASTRRRCQMPFYMTQITLSPEGLKAMTANPQDRT